MSDPCGKLCVMATAWIDRTRDEDDAWFEVPAGPKLAAIIEETEIERLNGSQQISFLKACERMTSWAQAFSATSMAAALNTYQADAGTNGPGIDSRADDWAETEIAAALHVSPRTAAHRINTAVIITEHHRQIRTALYQGHITYSQATVIAEAIATIDRDNPHTAYDIGYDLLEAVLPTAGNYPPARLRERTRHLLDRIAPEAATTRRKKTLRERTQCNLWNDTDALTTLAITGMTLDIHALHQHLTAHAETLRDADITLTEEASGQHPGSQSVDGSEQIHGQPTNRTLGQWRVAAALHLAGIAPLGMAPSPTDSHTPSGKRDTPKLDIRIIIDLPTALSLANHPAHLPGYGPLDPDLARHLAASGTWTRWITDPITGHLLDDGNRRFPTAGLARYIHARDHRCDAPGCSRTRTLDIDHVPTYATNPHTAARTLSLACITHNRQRENAGWTTPESHTWTTQLGRTYTTIPYQPLPQPDPPPPEPDPPPF